MEVISIQGRPVGRSHPPFVVAEMSGNHNQSLDRALEIVEAAAKAGAHALKLQTYTADTMTLDLAAGEFLLTILRAFGMVTLSTNSTKKLIPLGSGINQFLNVAANSASSALVRPLTRQQSIF